MKRIEVTVALLMVVVALPLGILAQETLSDPYEILGQHYEAVGGLEKLKSDSTTHFEGRISLFGMEGTVKQWSKPPYRQRQEISLPAFEYVSGDNGDFAWVVDQNGKLQVKKDDTSLKKREVEALMDLYEHLDPESGVFTLALEGIEQVAGEECYAIRISNSISESEKLVYIRTADFYQVKSVVIEPDHEMHILSSDFREVDGLLVPFKQEMEILPIGQKQSLEILTYEVNIDIDPERFEPPAEDVEDFRFLNGQSAENIPFEHLGNHIYLDVNLQCEKRRWCLDSGAGMSVIDSTFASELGLETSGESKAYGAGATVRMGFVTLPPYSVEGIEFDEQRAATLPLSGLFHKIGIDVSGILGYDFLSRFVTKIDFANQTLSFYRPDDFEYEGAGTVLDAPLKHNLFRVPMTVDGKYSGDWALDIGAGGASFLYPFAEKEGLLDVPGVDGLSGGAGGYFKTRVAKFESVDLGGFTLTGQLMALPLQEGGALGNLKGIGLLGNNILRHFVLYLDYERQQVILEKGGDFGKDFPVDKSGLNLVVSQDDEIKVFFVSPETPAEKAGFRTGDVVESINGIPVEHLDGLLAIKELLKSDAGTEYKFEVLREERPQSLRLRLEDLF
jgi:hypothetical protein